MIDASAELLSISGVRMNSVERMLVAECNAGGLGLIGRQIVLVVDTKQESIVTVHSRQIGDRTSDQGEIGVQLNIIITQETYEHCNITLTFSLVHSVFKMASRFPVFGTYEVSRVAFNPRANWLLISRTVPKTPSVVHFSVKVKPKKSVH